MSQSPAHPAESAEAALIAGVVEESAVSVPLRAPEQWLEEEPAGDLDSALGDDTESSTASITSSILRYRTLNGRTYHSGRVGGVYWGANDERQSEALDIQNQVYELSLEGKLFLTPLEDDIQKAVDIGTGTGIWAIDFADQFPNCQVIGTDISPIQPAWVPPNVRFQIEDFAQDWTFTENSIDFVHMRWLVGSVPDWTNLFREAFRVIKPGGWIESYDCDAAFYSDDGTVPPESALAQWAAIYREGGKKLGLKAPFDVVSGGYQRRAAEESGFVNIHEKPIKIPASEWAKDPRLREMGLFERCVFESDTEGFISLFASQVGFSKEAITLYAASVHRQLRDLNVHAYLRFHKVWAQKPLN